MRSKLTVAAVTSILVALAALLIWQQLRLRSLTARLAASEGRLDEARLGMAANDRLSEQLKAAQEQAEADRRELRRHQALTERMRQTELENAQLRAERERDRSKRPPPGKEKPLPESSPIEETPEWKAVHSRMMYSKLLGLCVLMYASDHQGQVPTSWAEAIASMRQDEVIERLADSGLPADASLFNQSQEIEMVFRGRIGETEREAGTTILARSKQPVQLSDGRWARAYVFDDGHGQIMAANTLEELAARELPLLAPTGP